MIYRFLALHFLLGYYLGSHLVKNQEELFPSNFLSIPSKDIKVLKDGTNNEKQKKQLCLSRFLKTKTKQKKKYIGNSEFPFIVSFLLYLIAPHILIRYDNIVQENP